MIVVGRFRLHSFIIPVEPARFRALVLPVVPLIIAVVLDVALLETAVGFLIVLVKAFNPVIFRVAANLVISFIIGYISFGPTIRVAVTVSIFLDVAFLIPADILSAVFIDGIELSLA